MNRREEKSKGEKERYKHLNASFQRIARGDKKAFQSEQCKEIEENRVEKTKDLFTKIRDTKGLFHVKMGSRKTEMVWTQQKQKIFLVQFFYGFLPLLNIFCFCWVHTISVFLEPIFT